MTVPSPACKARTMIVDFHPVLGDPALRREILSTEDHDDVTLANVIRGVLDFDPSASISWEA